MVEINASNEYIKEGKANIFLGSSIFYNPVQEFNRDMSVLCLSTFAEKFDIKKGAKPTKRHIDHVSSANEISDIEKDGIVVLEALAATGLRSVRYGLEVPFISKIIANDCSSQAVDAIQRNARENGIEHKIEAVNHDATWLMQKLSFEKRMIHVVDLDPYGCPTRFLDAAVNCISEGGLLMITCTDMAVIAGNTPETCYVKYGSVSLRSSSCHEMALRIALSCVSSHCGRYGKYIVPLLSISADFYIRLFLRVYSNQKKCKAVSSNLSMVYQCIGCEMTSLQALGVVNKTEKDFKYSLPIGLPVDGICIHCGRKHKTGGPIWTGPLHDLEFVDSMLNKLKSISLGTNKRIHGMLSVVKEELLDVPLYYTTDSLCSKLHCEMIPLIAFKSALINAGYRVSSSHCKTNSVKTNAPQTFIWDVLRSWVSQHPVSQKRLTVGDVTTTILSKQSTTKVDFIFNKLAMSQAEVDGVLRYQQNPLPNWGPGMRSKSNLITNSKDDPKRIRNQNKKTQNKKIFIDKSITNEIENC